MAKKILLNRIYTRRNKMKPNLKGVNEVSLRMTELACFWMLDQHWLHPRKHSLAAPDWMSATCASSVPGFQTKPKTISFGNFLWHYENSSIKCVAEDILRQETSNEIAKSVFILATFLWFFRNFTESWVTLDVPDLHKVAHTSN